ncbi:MAG: tyrosine-protein phosphatase [Aristaeellaceae bacterium]
MQLRRIPMDGPQNFRDLGGYAAREGRMVAWNRLYRADGLAGLTEADAARLKAMNVRTVVDLRSLSEQRAMPDKLPGGVRLCACPMMREDLATPDRAAEAFARSLTRGYMKMIGEDAALAGQAARAVMEGLAQGAVVFHCTAGKDRTGVLAAILLLLLGVAEEDIIADYQVSFTYNRRGVNQLLARYPEMQTLLAQSGEDSLLHSNPRNIQAVLEQLNVDNIGSWLERSGVGRDMQERFRQIMLEG